MIKMERFCNKKNSLVVGRGSVGIYLALCSEGIEGKRVLVPANICYAAVFPIILSGNKPLFCDVEKNSGNLSFAKIIGAITDDTAAVVLPHMYGNTVEDIEAITQELRKRDIILIEDCASSLGAKIGEKCAGDFGDYSVFSFGHSKTLDLGGGGMLFSDKSLKTANRIYKDLPQRTEKTEKNCDVFSKIYRLLRNTQDTDWKNHVYSALHELAYGMFLYRLDDKDSQSIVNSLNGIEQIVEKRRADIGQYERLIKDNNLIYPYKYNAGASPWRFNLIVEPEARKKLIKFLLDNGIFVSDWYPNVTDIFFDNGEYPNADYMEKRILNFPLSSECEDIELVCNFINRFFEV